MTTPYFPDETQGIYDPERSGGPEQDMIDPAISAIQATMQETMPELSQDAKPSVANEITEPNPPEFAETLSLEEKDKLLAAALYGRDYPPIESELPEESDWAQWVKGRWDAHRGAVEKHLHLVE